MKKLHQISAQGKNDKSFQIMPEKFIPFKTFRPIIIVDDGSLNILKTIDFSSSFCELNGVARMSQLFR